MSDDLPDDPYLAGHPYGWEDDPTCLTCGLTLDGPACPVCDRGPVERPTVLDAFAGSVLVGACVGMILCILFSV